MKPLHPHSGTLLVRHHRLLLRTARLDLRSRYAGSVFGAGWSVLTPLLVLSLHSAIYTLVLRVSPPDMTRLQYVLHVIAGLVPFMMTSESISQGVGSILTSKSVWTNTVFPVDLAPAKTVVLSQNTMIVGMTALTIASAVTGHLSWSILCLPFVWTLHMLLLVGVNWLLSMVTLIFRDLQNAISLMMMLLMIGTPIAYTREMVPPSWRPLLDLNPLSHFVRAYQQVLVHGAVPDPSTLLVISVVPVIFFWLGGRLFARAKPVLLDYV